MIDPAGGRYFYLVENRRADSRWFHWVDAEDGSLINAYDGLTTGSGIGVHGDSKDLTGLTTFRRGSYEMVSADGRQTTYDAGSKSRLPGRLATDDDDAWDTPGRTSPGQAALVDAHFYARVTDDYLVARGFDWMDFYSQGMVSSAHVRRNYSNAYWNGSQMAYGDGDGSTFVELSGDLDVVAHELNNGVTDATSDLIYQNESGALNEAFSDIMGTSVEFYNQTGNWTIGEDIMPSDDGIRDMANPETDGDPSHYDERYTGTADNGGVHWNSGIANHWYYLLVNGGQNADPNYASGIPVTGISMAAAEQIAFDGFTALNATADFCAARAGTIAVAGGHAGNVGDAWDEVGVDDALCSGGGGGGGGGGDTGGGDAPVISNVSAEKLRGVKFQISWDTDVASTTEVIFTCCGTYTKAQLVTSHSYDFNGSKGTTYEYFVASEDANGNRSTEGPFTHQN
jgi:thermolysin